MTGAPARASDWGWRHTAIVLLALVVGSAGAASLPLDDHEVFVVQTAQEMRETGDWIVPHLFGAPRLNKPPLSYWLAAGLAHAMGSPRVTAWQGRTASILGGAGLVALAMAIALAMLDAEAAAMAGLVAVSSLGLFRYTHSARPDMLYAFWCTAMLAGFVRGWRWPLPWLAAALATLTKGPQVPAMFLVAIVLVERVRGASWHALWRQLRPLGGIAVVLALTVPWWWAVDRALGARGLAGTQLAGSLLALSWSRMLDPYFFYRPLALVLPAAAILVAAVALRCPPAGPREVLRALAVLLVVPALAFSFGHQRRPHYMLPVLAPLSILLALCARAVFAQARATVSLRWLPAAAGLVCGAAIVVEAVLGGSHWLWSQERWVVAALGARAAQGLPSSAPLLTMGPGPVALSFYAGRPVRRVRSVARLGGLLAAAPRREAGLFADAGTLQRLPPEVIATLLDGGVGEDHRIVLARVSLREDAAVPPTAHVLAGCAATPRSGLQHPGSFGAVPPGATPSRATGTEVAPGDERCAT